MYNNVPKNPEYLMAHYNNKRVKFSQDSMCGDIDGHGGGVCGVCTPPLKPKITRHTPLPKAGRVCTQWCRTRRGNFFSGGYFISRPGGHFAKNCKIGGSLRDPWVHPPPLPRAHVCNWR